MPKKKNVQSSGNVSPETKAKGGTGKEEPWEPAPPKQDPQPYDNTLKAWFGEDARLIIREFLHDVELLGENSGDLNIEIDRTKLKADLVYTIWSEGERQLLNLELQNSLEEDDIVKMLQYALGLYAKHKLCVTSALLLPFSRAATPRL